MDALDRAELKARLGLTAAALLAVALAGLSFLHFRERAPAERTLRYTIPVPATSTFASFAISPDGRYVAFSTSTLNARRQLWLRALDTLQAQPMAGTEDS